MNRQKKKRITDLQKLLNSLERIEEEIEDLSKSHRHLRHLTELMFAKDHNIDLTPEQKRFLR